MRRFFLLSITLIVALVSSNAAATISGMVTDQSSDDKVSGVVLILTAAGTPATPFDTQTTGNNGAFTFSDVDQGEYVVSVSKTGYVTSINPVRVQGMNQNITLDVVLVQIGNARIGAIGGAVTDNANDRAIAGATMILSRRSGTGSGSTKIAVDTVSTNSSGSYLFTSVLISYQYTVTAIARGYTPQEKNQITVAVNDTTIADFKLAPLAPPTVRISGTVKDSVTGAAISGAQVILRFGLAGGGMGGSSVTWIPIDTVVTVATGAYVIDSIAPNTSENLYSIMVAAQTYRTWTSGSITLAANETDTVNVLLKKLNVAASHQSNSLISAVPGVHYSHGSLIFGSRINEATVILFTLDGRELFHTSLPAGVNRIELPNSLAGTGKALVVSVRGKDIALEQTIISSR